MAYPQISIIIPVKNEEARIESCLSQISLSSYPVEHIQVLVVDGMSEDNTRGVVETFAQTYIFRNKFAKT